MMLAPSYPVAILMIPDTAGVGQGRHFIPAHPHLSGHRIRLDSLKPIVRDIPTRHPEKPLSGQILTPAEIRQP
jgi:hypothetical protein